MSYLLDTHTLLWWLDNNPTLSLSTREVIANPNNLIFVSAVSAWEISIKKALGKLEAPSDLQAAIKRNRFEPLSISVQDGLEAGALPNYHNDPFDRMLIAQALVNKLTIITRDDKFKQYNVSLLTA